MRQQVRAHTAEQQASLRSGPKAQSIGGLANATLCAWPATRRRARDQAELLRERWRVPVR